MHWNVKYEIGALISMISLPGCAPKETGTFSQLENPNILFISVDDLRPELGCYGNPIIKSPVLDGLAADGVVFTRAYCNVPVCGASRASMLTGTRPTHTRFRNFRSRADEDYPEAVTLPRHFKNHGYYTVVMGKIFHNIRDSEDGWDEKWQPSAKGGWRNYLLEDNLALELKENSIGRSYERLDVPDSAYFDGQKALRAVRELGRLKERDQPFFLAVGLVKPHLPFNAPEKYWTMYDPDEIGLAPNPFRSKSAPEEAFHNFGELRAYHDIPANGPLTDELSLTLRHGYYACVSYIDAQIGLILEELENLGLSENTIVVVWGDHGFNLGEHTLWAKHCNFNTSLHAPLIFKVPGLTKGALNQSITEFIDIYPTLCELSDLPLPSHIDGKSLVNRLIAPEITEEDYAVSKYGNGLTLIEHQYFYTEWYDDNDRVIARMLFDHDSDPEENNNISENPKYSLLVSELSEKLKERRGIDFFPAEGSISP